MSLISQPGSGYQAAQVILDAGNARDIMLLLLDVHAVLDHLYLDGTQPQITAPAEDYLRESASPYTLPALIGALADVITMLTRAPRHWPASQLVSGAQDPAPAFLDRCHPAPAAGKAAAAQPLPWLNGHGATPKSTRRAGKLPLDKHRSIVIRVIENQITTLRPYN